MSIPLSSLLAPLDISTVRTDPFLSQDIHTNYSVITQMRKKGLIADYRINQTFDNSENVIMEFEDIHGQIYYVTVEYDRLNDRIFPDDPYRRTNNFSAIQEVVTEGRPGTFQLRPDLYQDRAGNVAFEYISDSLFNSHEIDLVYLDAESNQIYPIKTTKIRV